MCVRVCKRFMEDAYTCIDMNASCRTLLHTYATFLWYMCVRVCKHLTQDTYKRKIHIIIVFMYSCTHAILRICRRGGSRSGRQGLHMCERVTNLSNNIHINVLTYSCVYATRTDMPQGQPQQAAAIHVCHMTHPYLRHDSFMSVACLMHISTNTQLH